MEEKEPTLKDLAQAIADNTDLLRKFITYAEGRFEKIDQRFEHVDERFDRAAQESADQFRQVHREFDDLREVTMPLEEQSELRLRVRRIEDHLGLPHEVKPA